MKIGSLQIGLFLSLGFFFQATGQNYVDLLKVDYSFSGQNKFANETGTSDVYETVVDALVPIVLSSKTTFLTGILYENVRVTIVNNEPALSVYTINPKLGINRKNSEKWSGTYMLLPKFSSDLNELGRMDFQLGVVTIFRYDKTSALNYKFGLYYNSELFGPFLVPLIGLYNKSEKFETNIMLPMLLDINYSISDLLRVGFKFSGFKKSFNLNAPEGTEGTYLSKTNNEAFGYLAVGKGKVQFIGMIGRSIGRNYRVYNNGDRIGLGLSAVNFGDDRTQLNTDFKDGYVFRGSLIYRYML